MIGFMLFLVPENDLFTKLCYFELENFNQIL